MSSHMEASLSAVGVVGVVGGAGGGEVDESVEISLAETALERKQMSSLADLYAIMQMTEQLEAALSRFAITPEEYRRQYASYMRSYNMTKEACIKEGTIVDILTFMKTYNIHLHRAFTRLELEKLPATDMYASTSGGEDAINPTTLLETASALITVKDGIDTGLLNSADLLAPNINMVLESINKHSWLGADFAGRATIQQWVRRVSAMKAADELDEGERRQLRHDIQLIYDEFNSTLAARTARPGGGGR